MSVEYWNGRPPLDCRITTCGECKATQTMRASGICKECEEAEKPQKWDGADGF